jgi:penicillin-binding protein 1B
MPRKKASKRRARKSGSQSFVRRHPWWSLLLGALLLFLCYLLYLNWQISSRFEGRRWDLPARVYARPLELYAGLELQAGELEQELRRLGYRASTAAPHRPGSFRRSGGTLEIVTREFRFWDELQPATKLRVRFDRDRIAAVDVPAGRSPVVRLDPLMVGSIFPQHGEDRLIVTPEQVPEQLRTALMVVEDRRFLQHIGVDPIALGRAVIANLRAGEVTQGGSTLTQQLVKNYFLDNRRTLTRKLREALMAVVLELHYPKADILNAYINEIYLGQDGQRAVHGFGLASQFYFSRPLHELELHQLALLVALVRGPGYYDPLRAPERALARRNLVLDLMEEAGELPPEEARQARQQPLDIWDRKAAGASYYPAYLALVREELAEQYRAEDLTRVGLRIFSALDPLAQASAERRLAEGLAELDQRQPDRQLAGAAVIASPQSGDVLAIVGDRRAGYEGFNRALAASRPVGSLIKPVVYLAALESGRYTLASPVEDAPIEVPLPNGDTWRPRNFSEEALGEVTLLQALAESLNMATVRLGMDVGVDRVADLLVRLGFDRPVAPYPSLLLGAIEMTPMQVVQVYSSLANDGFRTPLRAVRSVVNADGEPLQRFPLEVAQVVDPASAYQLNQGLVTAMTRGTGRSAGLPFTVAGKTGTSDEFRDSWFAGFSGDRVAAVWIGYDDYRPTTLSGASGALRIWTGIMRDVSSVPYAPPLPADLEARWVDYHSGALVSRNCSSAVHLAVPAATRLSATGGCSGGQVGIGERTLRWLNDVFN